MTMHNNPHPILETPRLTLRALRNSDAGLTSLYTSDLRVARMTSRIPHPNPPGAVEAFIAHANAPTTQETTWAIDASKGFGTELVGVISIDDDGDIGYWVAPFFWGLGLASEALDAVVAFAASLASSSLASLALVAPSLVLWAAFFLPWMKM